MAITDTIQSSGVKLPAVRIAKDPEGKRIDWVLKDFFPDMDVGKIKRIWLCVGTEDGVWDIRNADVGNANYDCITTDAKRVYVQLLGTVHDHGKKDEEGKEHVETVVSLVRQV